MEYYYQWSISKESPPIPEHKRCGDSFWGKSARCMRRRGLCLPPSNYYPRGHRPQLNPSPFRNYDYSWKPLVSKSPQPFCGMEYERSKPIPAPSHKKRPCHNRGNKKPVKPCDNERGHFHGASPQLIPGRYWGSPIINDVYFNAFDYQRHIVERGHGLPYDPYLDCSNGLVKFCESSSPMEERVKNPSYSGNDLLSTAVKVAIEEPLTEQVDFLVSSTDTSSIGEGVVKQPKDEAEAAAQTLEELFPSLRFSSAEGLGETHQFLNPVENSTDVQEELKKKEESEKVLPVQSSEEKPIDQEERIGGSLEGSKPIADSSIAQDSVQFLANQNQFLSDVLSQFMSGRFDLNQSFMQKYQNPDETQNENAEKLDESPLLALVSSTENNVKNEDSNQEILTFNDSGLSETLQCKDESKNLHKATELSNFESDINCNSSSIDWDIVFGKNQDPKCEETTQGSTNTQVTLPNYAAETDEVEFLKCVNPNAILKDKRPRKRLKRVISNVEAKTKKVRLNNKRGSKEGEEETMCKTDVYTSTEESDAQTQREEKVIFKVDATTQWYDSDVKGEGNPLKDPPELDAFNIDLNFNNSFLEQAFTMPNLENQYIGKEGNREDNSKSDADMYESLFKSLAMSAITDGKENKCLGNEINDHKTHVGATESIAANMHNSGFSTSTETVSGFLYDFPIKSNEEDQVKNEDSRRDIQHSDNIDVAAYEVCSGECVSHVSILPAQDAMEIGVNKTTRKISEGFECVAPDECDSSKCESAKLTLTNQGSLHFDKSKIESIERESSVTIKRPSESDETEQMEFEIENPSQEKLTDKKDRLFNECEVEILPLENSFEWDPDLSSSKSRPGRPRKKRTSKESNSKSRKTVKSPQTGTSPETAIPQTTTTVRKRTSDPESDQPPVKKLRLASLRCRPEFQKMM